jgi:hypothetical protein
MAATEFVPEWRLCHVAHSCCAQCGRAVREEKVWRYFIAPAQYRWNLCLACAEACQALPQ